MMIKSLIACAFLMMPIVAYSDDLSKVHINGKTFGVYGNYNQGFAYTFNGHAFTPDDYSFSSKIFKIIEGDGKTYVITVDQDDGSASAPQYRAFDVTGDAFIPSALIGQGIGDHLDGAWSVIGGDAVATIQKDDGSSATTFHIRDGLVHILTQGRDNSLSGPSTPPGGDYAAFVAGMRLKEAFHSKAINPILRKAFPEPVYSDVFKLAEEDFGSAFQAGNQGSFAFLSQPHDSRDRYIAIAIQPNGTAVAIFSSNGHHEVTYGNPDPLIKMRLQREIP
ncbi:hypothetical protein [Gluconobacter albidus]|nr:hypothetical protein [Gluconobacter albidus]